MNTNDIDLLNSYFKTRKRIVFISHKNPDGDALGSTLSLSRFYEKLGHTVQVIFPNNLPNFLSWLPHVENAYIYDLHTEKSKKAIACADVIFLLDFNSLKRVGDQMEISLNAFKGDFIMVDHHQQPDDIAMVTYSDSSISSTSEMVYHYIDAFGRTDLIDCEMATCIYTGIMTDTGSFRFSSTTSTTHKVIANLIDKGVKNATVHNNVFFSKSYDRLQLLSIALRNLKTIEDAHTAYTTLSYEELEACNHKRGDSEDIVNYGLFLKGVIFSAIFIEDQKQRIIKISFRSKGDFSVNQFSRTYFNGGGHDNAAGGKSNESLKDTVDKFIDIVSNRKKEMIQFYEF